jgi:hypothetical protein
MNKNIVHSGQTFFNKVIECTGDIDNAFAMMLLNKKKSLTDNDSIGTELKATNITDYDVVDFYEDRKPATKQKIKIIPEFDYLLPGEFPYSF